MSSSINEHLASVLELAGPLPPRQLPIADCLGLVLAEDLAARLPVPTFTNSAMDGFAVIAADVAAADTEPVWLDVVGDLPAGHPGDLTVAPGQAARIMTGAPLPAGADAVVQVELTDQPLGPAELPERVQIRGSRPVGANVRPRGEDVGVGEVVLSAGTTLSPAALASAASIGYGELPVHPRPRVAVLATGSELVAPGVSPGPGQIPDSNSLMMAALVEQAGAEVVLAGHATDEVADFRRAIGRALAADLIVTTGGVSVGAFDVVRDLAASGEVRFSQVKMQPGKPQGHGSLRDADGRHVPLLAVPGNPVSAFVSFQVFVRPLLDRLSGLVNAQPWRTGVARAAVAWDSPPGRRQLVPVALDHSDAEWACTPSHRLGSGSHLVASLHRAEALAVVDEDVEHVPAGTVLEIIYT